MSNIIDKIQLSGVTYDIGGGKAIEAGRGISITSGETADTVSFDLPISAGTGTNSLIGNGDSSNQNVASGDRATAFNFRTTASANNSHAEGGRTTAAGANSHAEGAGSAASGDSSHAEGRETRAKNASEHASGQYNVSSKASTTFGNSGNTLFSVGNGTADNARHNAFEIRQNGDIYISSGGTDIKLQDNLGGGSGGNNVVELTQEQYDALDPKDPTAFYIITDASGGDLSNYYTKTEINENFYNKTQIDTMIGNIESLLAAI